MVIMTTIKYFTRLYSSMRLKDLVNYLKIIEFIGEEILCSTIKERMEKILLEDTLMVCTKNTDNSIYIKK
jgi:hypothetical protein